MYNTFYKITFSDRTIYWCLQPMGIVWRVIEQRIVPEDTMEILNYLYHESQLEFECTEQEFLDAIEEKGVDMLVVLRARHSMSVEFVIDDAFSHIDVKLDVL